MVFPHAWIAKIMITRIREIGEHVYNQINSLSFHETTPFRINLPEAISDGCPPDAFKSYKLMQINVNNSKSMSVAMTVWMSYEFKAATIVF